MIVAIIQARMTSSRLPGKVMLDLAGEPVLFRVVERARAAKRVDEVVVATSTDSSDDSIAELCDHRTIKKYRGSLNDVLTRYRETAQAFPCEYIVRITSDCPLVDPHVIDLCVEGAKKGNYDYIGNSSGEDRTFPRGLDVEVFSRAALENAYHNAKEPAEREHVTPYIWKNKKGDFKIGPTVEAAPEYRRNYRLTLDYEEDYKVFKKIYETFRSSDLVSVPEVLKYLDQHPEVVALNMFRDKDHVSRLNV